MSFGAERGSDSVVKVCAEILVWRKIENLLDLPSAVSSSLSSMSTLFHSAASGTPRRALFFFLPNAFSGSCLGPKTSASTSAQDTVICVSPLVFFEFPFVIFGTDGSFGAMGSCDCSRDGLLSSSKATKASVMRRSTLPGASLDLLCRHRSEQYFTGVDAAFVVCDFRVPSMSDVSIFIVWKYGNDA